MAAESKTFDANDSPSAWFACLESALHRGKPDLARQAEAELRRLGVRVKFSRRWEKKAVSR